jgi:hypothetical protein
MVTAKAQKLAKLVWKNRRRSMERFRMDKTMPHLFGLVESRMELGLAPIGRQASS